MKDSKYENLQICCYDMQISSGWFMIYWTSNNNNNNNPSGKFISYL